MTESASGRGKLKIFFGAFPGAGKTNAMLTAARRIREDGRDVVVGVVDAHESAELELLEGFETLPTLPPDTLPQGALANGTLPPG